MVVAKQSFKNRFCNHVLGEHFYCFFLTYRWIKILFKSFPIRIKRLLMIPICCNKLVYALNISFCNFANVFSPVCPIATASTLGYYFCKYLICYFVKFIIKLLLKLIKFKNTLCIVFIFISLGVISNYCGSTKITTTSNGNNLWFLFV